MITPFRLLHLLPIGCAALLASGLTPGSGNARILGAGEPAMGQVPKPMRAANEPSLTDPCGQIAMRRFIGSMITPRAIVSITRTVRHERIRVVRPGRAIAQDLREDRLNLIVDEGGHLLAARCG